MFMVNKFQVKKIFSEQRLEEMIQEFAFLNISPESLGNLFQNAFSDYVLSAFSEMSGAIQDHRRLYVEAVYHTKKATKLLRGLPHPAGKMAIRLSAMSDTLEKLANGQQNVDAERATRFLEKNLVRRLKHIWTSHARTSFFDNPDMARKYLIVCLNSAGQQYPEIAWLSSVDDKVAETLMKSIRR